MKNTKIPNVMVFIDITKCNYGFFLRNIKCQAVLNRDINSYIFLHIYIYIYMYIYIYIYLYTQIQIFIGCIRNSLLHDVHHDVHFFFFFNFVNLWHSFISRFISELELFSNQDDVAGAYEIATISCQERHEIVKRVN